MDGWIYYSLSLYTHSNYHSFIRKKNMSICLYFVITILVPLTIIFINTIDDDDDDGTHLRNVDNNNNNKKIYCIL